MSLSSSGGSRREFLKTMAVAGSAAVTLQGQRAFAEPASQSADGRLALLANEFLSISLDNNSGRLGIWEIPRAQEGRHRGHLPQIVNAVARVVTADERRRVSSDPEYTRTIERKTVHGGPGPIQDPLGPGQQLVWHCKDGLRQLDLELKATCYDGRPGLVLELICRNVSNHDVVLNRLEPVSAVARTGGSFAWPGLKKLLTNGKMYYDAGRVLDATETAHSWWDLGLYRGERRPGLVIGYLDNQNALGRIRFQPAPTAVGADSSPSLGLTAESLFPAGFVLRAGQSVSSGRLVFNPGPDPFTALESYAQAIGDLHQVRLNPIINGWCSWFSFFGAITEDEVIRQAEFAAKHLKPYGFEWIQVDDGFYRAFGDWEGNAKFPHGMKWLARRIREIGLKPGIWLAPYCISKGTEVYERHPDWLVHNLDGSLKACGPSLQEDSPEAKVAQPGICSLDITHPDAARWLHHLFKTACDDWGYDFVKIDFVDWTILSAKRYHDPTASHANVYRRGCEIMRNAMGPKRHLLDCGPGPVSVGLIDSMRIELDQPPVTWQQYFLHPASTAPAAAKRYYHHKRNWINDADHVVLSNLTEAQAKAAASIVALSGGTLISGDRMSDLDATRLEILKKVMPSYGEAARPIDLFESDCPSIFAWEVKRDFGCWLVLGVFNADEKTAAEKTIPLERLRLDSGKTYVAFDFWKQRFYGEIRDAIKVRLEPASVALLAIHERRGVPQVISTDRHVSQGGIELEKVEWDAAGGKLRGTSLGPASSMHNVYVYLPEAHPWEQRDLFLFHDRPGYTLKIMESHILRVQVRFDDAGRVRWELDTKAFFGEGPAE